MVANVSSVPQLQQYESFAILALRDRVAGTYTQQLQIRGNSILSGLYVESMDPGATLKVNYYDHTTGVSERNPLASHTLVTAPSTEASKILINRFHDKPTVEAIVSGGNVKFSVYATIITDPLIDISSTAFSDLVQAATANRITNLPIPIPNTEVSHALQPSVKKLMIQARGSSKVQFAFNPTESSTTFITIPRGNSYSEDLINLSGTLYVQCDKIDTLEIIEWT